MQSLKGSQVSDLNLICSNLQERADLLEEWKKDGGVMIMGYNIFRILANHPTRSKKKKEIFDKSLLDPGMHRC